MITTRTRRFLIVFGVITVLDVFSIAAFAYPLLNSFPDIALVSALLTWVME